MNDLLAEPEDSVGRRLKVQFKEMNVIQADMKKLQDMLEQLRQVAQEQDRCAHTAEVQARMKGLVHDVLSLARSTKSSIDLLAGKGTSRAVEAQILSTFVTSSRTKLKEIMSEFSRLRERITEEHRQTVKRRYQVLTGEVAGDEIVEHIIATGQSETFIRRAVQQQGLGAAGRLQIIDTLKEIDDRHDSVLMIEGSLREVHQIFLDLATLVESQGELINSIEENVRRTAVDIESGRSALADTKKTQKRKHRYLLFCVFALLGVIFLSAGITLLVSYRRDKQ